MTVRELITRLLDMPADSEVVVLPFSPESLLESRLGIHYSEDKHSTVIYDATKYAGE